MSEYLRVTRNKQILEIVLDNPKANTISGSLSREMGKLFTEFRDDPELRVVMAPDVATFMLLKIIPRQKAFELLMTGRRQSAQDFVALGIVNEVVPAEGLARIYENARKQ